MRILQVHNEYRIHGGENVVLDRERDDLEAAGHDVIRYTATNDGGQVETLAALALAPWNPREARRITQLITDEQPDVMHVHNTWFRLSPAPIVAASRIGLPVVHTLHNFRWLCVNGEMIRDNTTCRDCVSFGRLAAVKHRCYRSSTPLSIVAAVTGEVAERSGTWKRHIDRFIALTPTARDLFSLWGFPTDRIVVRPHRIGDPGPRQVPPAESDTVLFAGRVSDAKGVPDLCRAWASKPRRQKLVIVGDGPLRPDLESRYPDIAFLGQLELDDVIDRMRRSRAVILPTRGEEAFPLVVVEGMACGLPVALSDVALVRGYVEQVGPEWSFSVARPGEWERVFALIDDDRAVAEGGTRARAVYEANFAEDGATSLVDIYADAIANRRMETPGPPA